MDKLDKPLESWREELSPTQFQVCRLKGTEHPFSGEYYATKTPGTYHCACCGAALFDSDAKYDSGSGWPSYFQPVSKTAISEKVSEMMVNAICSEPLSAASIGDSPSST